MFTGKISWPLNFFPGIKNLIHWLVFLSVRFFQLSKNNSKLKSLTIQRQQQQRRHEIWISKNFSQISFYFVSDEQNFCLSPTFYEKKNSFCWIWKNQKTIWPLRRYFEKNTSLYLGEKLMEQDGPIENQSIIPLLIFCWVEILSKREMRVSCWRPLQRKSESTENPTSIKFFKIRTCFGAAAARLKW